MVTGQSNVYQVGQLGQLFPPFRGAGFAPAIHRSVHPSSVGNRHDNRYRPSRQVGWKQFPRFSENTCPPPNVPECVTIAWRHKGGLYHPIRPHAIVGENAAGVEASTPEATQPPGILLDVYDIFWCLVCSILVFWYRC